MPNSNNSYYGPQTLGALNAATSPIDIDETPALSIQVVGVTSPVLVFVLEQSVNGVVWSSSPLQALTSTSTSANGSATNPSLGAFFVSTAWGKFARVRISSYTSGSISIIVGAIAEPPVTLNLTSGGNTTPADSVSPTGTVQSATYPSAFDGTTWSRLRTASGASSNGNQGLAVAGGTGDTLTLSNVSVAGVGTTVDMGSARDNHRITILGNVGTGVVIRFEISPDNVNWVPITVQLVDGSTGAPTGNDITSNGLYRVTDLPIRRARLNIITAGTGMSGVFGWITSA